jgi:hypothetical protein
VNNIQDKHYQDGREKRQRVSRTENLPGLSSISSPRLCSSSSSSSSRRHLESVFLVPPLEREACNLRGDARKSKMCNLTEGKRAPDVEGREKGKVQTPWAATIVGRMEYGVLLSISSSSSSSSRFARKENDCAFRATKGGSCEATSQNLRPFHGINTNTQY